MNEEKNSQGKKTYDLDEFAKLSKRLYSLRCDMNLVEYYLSQLGKFDYVTIRGSATSQSITLPCSANEVLQEHLRGCFNFQLLQLQEKTDACVARIHKSLTPSQTNGHAEASTETTADEGGKA